MMTPTLCPEFLGIDSRLPCDPVQDKRGHRPAISIMTTQKKLLWQFLMLLIFAVEECRPVCVDAISDTEAVLGSPMKLTCILCMKREEISAQTKVSWYYRPDQDAVRQMIYKYDGKPKEVEGPWKGRLLWNGSKDLQDVSISISNVSLNDSGLYECEVHRQFSFNSYSPSTEKTFEIELVVREKASDDPTALYSEIMMYVLLVFLTFWLLVEMIYCYRKISKSDEQVQDSVTDYLAIPSENKENPPGPAVTE
ncbi:sodium channel subunit beta-3 isoform X1 [Ictalurus punctatus]|uniref:Sodium channel regulatory subunit beta-3 n=2 Tax=Ictalurus punctatus TaxID=7998 RepID=A0A2D0SWQ4_ICTPU|nr:sodium channel subunit beta-3 isoform X1 [Ictalurus punctatus]